MVGGECEELQAPVPTLRYNTKTLLALRLPLPLLLQVDVQDRSLHLGKTGIIVRPL